MTQRPWLFLCVMAAGLALSSALIAMNSPSSENHYLFQTATPTPFLRAPPTPTPTPTVTPTATPISEPRVVAGGWHLVTGPAGSGHLQDLACLDGLVCWAAVSRGQYAIYITEDGGATWRGSGPPAEWGSYRVHLLDHQLGFIQISGAAWWTEDGGRSWEQVMVDGDPLQAVLFVNAAVGFGRRYDQAQRLYLYYKTTDSGRTWRIWDGQVHFPSRANDVVLLDEDVAWAADSHRVFYTTDGWRSRHVVLQGDSHGPGTTYLNTVDFVDYWHGWVGGGYPDWRPYSGTGLIYRTFDAGQTWQQINLPKPLQMVSSLDFIDRDQGWAIIGNADRTLVVVTRNGGATWSVEIEAPGPGWYSSSFLRCLPSQVCWTGIPNTRASPSGFSMYRREPTNGGVIPAPQPPGPCPWEGYWDTLTNVGNFGMRLIQSGSLVRGTYGGDRSVDAIAAGDRLSGRWAGPPNRMEPLHAGRLEFVMASDCSSFSGTWGFDASRTDGGIWTGSRTVDPERLALVRAAYLAILGREPEPRGLADWARSSLPRLEIEAALAASPEGQRVSAVRALYRQILMRDPLGSDNGGLRYWVDTPWSLGEIESHIAAAPEARRVLAIRELYRELLGREADPDGLRYWVSSPLTIEQVQQALLNSEEYLRNHG